MVLLTIAFSHKDYLHYTSIASVNIDYVAKIFRNPNKDKRMAFLMQGPRSPTKDYSSPVDSFPSKEGSSSKSSLLKSPTSALPSSPYW